MSLRVAFMGLFLSGLALATSFREESFSVRVQRAQRVVRARVSNTYSDMANGDPRRLYTVSQLEVLETVKGPASTMVEVVQLGGKSGRWELQVTGDARLSVGDEAFFLLRCADAKAPDRCTLLGLSEGKLPVLPGVKPGDWDVVVPHEGRKPLKTFKAQLKAHASLPSTTGEVRP
jgi:hypothetical protein